MKRCVTGRARFSVNSGGNDMRPRVRVSIVFTARACAGARRARGARRKCELPRRTIGETPRCAIERFRVQWLKARVILRSLSKAVTSKE
jgi:hypothetical protein